MRPLIAPLLLGLAACSAEPESACGPDLAQVVHVIDGDTVVLEGGERLRYLLVDTPEITAGKSECWGEDARAFNESLVLGQVVSLRYEAECRDRHGRWLAWVSLGDREVNALLVERGHACVLHLPPTGSDRVSAFRAAERRAREERRGLWGACERSPCQR